MGAFLENRKLGYLEFSTAKVEASTNRKTGRSREGGREDVKEKKSSPGEGALQRNVGGKSGLLHLLSRKKTTYHFFLSKRDPGL